MPGNAPEGLNFWGIAPLGVVQATFDGTDLGKTMDDTTIQPLEDIKDIMYAQDGTQPGDKIPTGMAFEIKMKLAEVSTARLAKLVRGFTVSTGGNSVKMKRDLYRSGKTNFSKLLTLKRVDSDGVVTTNALHIANFYKAMPISFGTIDYGADTQRGLEVTFYCFWDSTNNAFGYSGYASSLGT